MITRIVQMTFKEGTIEQFMSVWEANKTHIRAMEGCNYLRLYKDEYVKNRYYTYSHWTGEAALNTYRNSELFGVVWPASKRLFAERAQAKTLKCVTELK